MVFFSGAGGWGGHGGQVVKRRGRWETDGCLRPCTPTMNFSPGVVPQETCTPAFVSLLGHQTQQAERSVQNCVAAKPFKKSVKAFTLLTFCRGPTPGRGWRGRAEKRPAGSLRVSEPPAAFPRSSAMIPSQCELRPSLDFR